jgi:hypothetical protein
VFSFIASYLVLAEKLTSNSVEYALTVASDETTLLAVLLANNISGLKGLEHGAQDTTGGASMMLTNGTTVITATEHMAQGTDTNSTTHVHATGHSSGAHEVPIWIKRGKFLVHSGFDEIVPLWELDITTILEVGGESLDELTSWGILDGWTGHLK